MNAIEEIKKRLDIVEYIGARVSLTKLGRNFKAPCPFHSEKTPSFVVSPDRQIWHCFGSCAEGGDIFKFLMKWENLTFPEALKILATEANVTLEHNFEDKEAGQKQKLFELNQMAADFYHFLLQKHRLGEKARAYLEQRKINLKTADHFYLGYAPNSWDSLSKYLLKKNFAESLLIESGLSLQGKTGKLYDRFRGRLTFPLTDSRGNVLGFSGRILNPDEKEAKYINSPETLVYHKRENLFGLKQAQEAIREKKEIILMEGEFDVLQAHQNGFTQAVAIKGTALTDEHLRLIKRLTMHLIFCLDMDIAGNSAVIRGISEAEKFDFQMEVMELEGGKDAADIFTTTPEEFKRAYKDRLTIYEFIIEAYKKKINTDSIYGQREFIEKTLPYIQSIQNPIVKDYYLKNLSDKSGIPLETIRKNMFFLKNNKVIPKLQDVQITSVIKSKTAAKKQGREEYLLAILVQLKEQSEFFKLVGELKNTDFTVGAVYELIQKARTAYEAKADTFLETLNTTLPRELLDLYNRAFLIDLPQEKEINWSKEIRKIVLNIKKDMLKEILKKNSEPGSEQKNFQEDLKSLKEVEKELALL